MTLLTKAQAKRYLVLGESPVLETKNESPPTIGWGEFQLRNGILYRISRSTGEIYHTVQKNPLNHLMQIGIKNDTKIY